MVLNLQQTYEYGDGGLLRRQVAAGAYSNVRIYSWNAGIYPIVYGTVPAFATTHGALDTLGGACSCESNTVRYAIEKRPMLRRSRHKESIIG